MRCLSLIIFALSSSILFISCGGGDTGEVRELNGNQQTPAAKSCSVTDTCDGDGDGIVDSEDQCKDTPTGVDVDSDGCEALPDLSKQDADSDGVFDDVDECLNTAENVTVNSKGCEIVRSKLSSAPSDCDSTDSDALFLEAEDYTDALDQDEENNGQSYRDDSVDINATPDECGTYSVGWIKKGEWLEYSINLEKGEYLLSTRLAADGNDAEIRFSLDEALIESFSPEDTGKLATYSTQEVANFEVESDGVYTFKVDILEEGLNLNWFKFEFLGEIKEPEVVDTDGDGVEDNIDQCPDTKNGVTVDDDGCDTDIKILVFSKTDGFRHDSIEDGKSMLESIGAGNNWQVDLTENANDFSASNLAQYRVIVWLSTTGNVLNESQQQAFEDYLESGGGYVGIHAAADCETPDQWGSQWYRDVVGAQFRSHPNQQTATIEIEDGNHPATAHLNNTWEKFDEWYNYGRNPRDEGVNVLMTLDESSYNPGDGAMGNDHPISWNQDVELGRVFYTGLGHTEASYSNSDFRKHVEGGIIWAGELPESNQSFCILHKNLKDLNRDD